LAMLAKAASTFDGFLLAVHPEIQTTSAAVIRIAVRRFHLPVLIL
jgi:hypothetical protein